MAESANVHHSMNGFEFIHEVYITSRIADAERNRQHDPSVVKCRQRMALTVFLSLMSATAVTIGSPLPLCVVLQNGDRPDGLR
jgi:hypothetical protein